MTSEIEMINSDIKECDEYEKENAREQDDFIRRMEGTYASKIKGFYTGLDSYADDQKEIDDAIYDNLEKIKEKLINYRDNLELEEHRHQIENEIERQPKQTIEVLANAKNANHIKVQVSVHQVLETIANLPESVISEEDKEELEDKLAGIEVSLENKEKVKRKIWRLLRFLADKGADAFIAVLPYLGKISAGL